MMDTFAIRRIPFSKPIDVEKEGYLKVISIGYTQSSNNRYRLNRMDDYLLTFVEEGEFIINNLPSEDRAYIKIKQGDIALFYPGESFEIIDSNIQSGRAWFHFEGTAVTQLLEELGANGKRVISVESSSIPRLMKRFSSIKEVVLNEEDTEINVNAKILNFLGSINALKNNDGSNEKIEKVAKYLNVNLKSEVNIKKLAEMSFLSESYFIKRFYEVFKTTPHKYLIMLRIEHAKFLLLNTAEKIGEIAVEVGYGDIGYFSCVFKKYTGMSPRKFRNLGGHSHN